MRNFGTHSGSFHADEVTACALLLYFDLIDRDKIVRTRDPSLLADCEYVCDVGGVYDPAKKLFDHHQAEYQGEMSSAGMILRYLVEIGKIAPTEREYINRALIHGVDAHDNGREPPIYGWCSFSHVVANFNPIEHGASSEVQDQAFFEALDFVVGHISRLFVRMRYIESCAGEVRKAMEGDPVCLEFEQSLPWLEPFFELGGEEHPALFVVMPSGDHWKLRGIPPSYEEKMSVRHPLPEEWAGLHHEDLAAVSKIPGAIFCHKGRFISVWETKEDAMKALHYVLGVKNGR